MPKCQRYRHGNDDPGLQTRLEHDGDQPEEGRQRCQYNGPEALACRIHDGLDQRNADCPLTIDEVNQDQAVIHHHAGQRDDAEETHHADFDADDPVSDQGADGAKRNHRHDNQRL